MAVKKCYVTEITVSEITAISLSKLRNDRHHGRGIPYIKLGRSCRYSIDDVLEYMETHKIQTRQ